MFTLFDGPSGLYETFRFLEEKGQAGLFCRDLVTQAVNWSPGMYLLMRVESGTVDLNYDFFKSLVHPDDCLPVGGIDDFYENGTSFDREFRIIHPNGRLRYVRSIGEYIVDHAGKPTKLIGVTFDITAQKEDTQALQKKADRIREILDSIVPVMWRARCNGFVIDMIGWRELTGQKEAEFIGNGWLDAIDADDRPAVADAWNAAIENSAPLEIEHRLRLFDDDRRWYRTHATPIFGKDAKLSHWNGVCIDIHTARSPAKDGLRLPVITGLQVRAARGILKWSVRDLSQTSGISEAIIRRVEEFDGVAPHSEKSIDAIKKTLVSAGVELLFFPPDNKSGVRLVANGAPFRK